MDGNEPDILFKPTARANGLEELMTPIEISNAFAVARMARADSGLTGE
jgi:hypothetical protein